MEPAIQQQTIKDKAPKPAGLVPKNLQAFVLVGLALLMVLIMALTGHKRPAPTANSETTTSVPNLVPLNTDKVIVLKNAAVARLIWANPHCIVAFDATDEKGNLVRWAAEVGSPSAMNQMGWNRNSVKPGDVVTIFLFQAKTGNPVGRINKIVLADGTTLRDSALGGDRGAPDAPAH